MRAGLAALAILLAVPSVALADGRFADDDGHPGELALEWLADRDVVHGCNPPRNTESCPGAVLTRAQAAKILVLLARAEGYLDGIRPGGVDHFRDDDEVWGGAAEPFIDHLADLRIVHGCDPPGNRLFCPGEPLLRGQITKMIVGTFELAAPADFVSPWTDTAGEYFHEAARVAAYHGLFDTSGGVFDGYSEVTRAEFARAVVRLFEPDLCRDRPFTEGRLAGLRSDHPGVEFTAYVYDVASRCAHAMAADSRQQLASVFKVMVLGGTLAEAENDGRSLSRSEMDLLEAMITESANQPVRDLWRSFGGAPWFREQAERFGLADTDVVGDYEQVWGRTTSSARDQADLLRQVLLGHGGELTDASRSVAFELMTSVVAAQSWGVSAGVPAEWTVALKNGFAAATTNSVGVVYDESGEPVYVAAILTYGWDTWQQGVATVEEIGTWVSRSLAD